MITRGGATRNGTWRLCPYPLPSAWVGRGTEEVLISICHQTAAVSVNTAEFKQGYSLLNFYGAL